MALRKATKVTFTPAAGATNVCEVTIAVKDWNGNTIPGVHHLDVWLGTSAGVIHGTSASGTVQAKSASGTVLQIYSAKKSFRVETLANGTFVLEITDSAKTTFNICAQTPGNGRTHISTALVTGNYG